MLLLLAIAFSTALAAPPAPNIVFFLVDDLGWNDVSFHGSPQIPTPTFDRLAKSGIALNQYYVNPVCSPTRASLMTGRSAMHTGIQTPYGSGDDASGLNLTYTLLPEQLKKQFNYTSYMVGKWHLGSKNKDYLPSSRGFNKYYGYYLGDTDYWKHEHNEQGLDLHSGGVGLGMAPGMDQPMYNTSGQYSTELYASIASQWIHEHDQSAPMFLYLAFQGAHSANNNYVQAPADLIDQFSSISPTKTCGQFELPLKSDNCDKAAMRKTIAATVFSVDTAVATVEQALKDAGMLSNTLLVLSSDNGGPTDGTNNNMMNNFPLRSGKGETFEGGIRAVGFVAGVWLSDQVKGTTNNQLFHVSDWYLSLLDFVGKTVASSAASSSSSSSSFNAAPVPPPSLVLKHNERPFIDGDGIANWNALSLNEPSQRTEILIAAQAAGSSLTAQALRSQEWKLIKDPHLLYNMPYWYPPPLQAWNYTTLTVQCPKPPSKEANVDVCENHWCLFNLTADPCEHRNVASQHPEVVHQLQQRLAELTKTTVLTWVNFSEKDIRANPVHFGPTTPITPDPQPHQGPHFYKGVWSPWLSALEANEKYPAAYVGPGYPAMEL